jgi:HEPN domain-containing protein
MNIEAAKSMVEEAGDCLDETQRAYSKQSYNLAVRRAQEAVELSMKGVMRMIGIEYPRKHDIGDVFIEQKTRFSQYEQNVTGILRTK